MLSKGKIEFPYISPEPLSETTEWVSFPLLIVSSHADYSGALRMSMETAEEIVAIARSKETDQCKIVESTELDEIKELKTTFSFEKADSESLSKVYQYITISFREGSDLWGKMQMISTYLDALTGLCQKYKNNKKLSVELGQQLHMGKKH